MKNLFTLIICCMVLFPLSHAHAEDGKFGLGIKAGTIGVGAEAEFALAETLHLRGGINYLTFSFDSTISNVDYEMEPTFKSGSLLLDWHPFLNGFRLTGGIFLNNNEICLTGTPRTDTFLADYSIPDEYAFAQAYADSIRISGTVDFNPIAPYVGIGWNSNAEQQKGWGMSLELGVLFMGSPNVSELTVTAAPPLDQYADHPVVQDVLENERQAIEDDLEDFQYYPVLNVMLHYTF